MWRTHRESQPENNTSLWRLKDTAACVCVRVCVCDTYTAPPAPAWKRQITFADFIPKHAAHACCSIVVYTRFYKMPRDSDKSKKIIYLKSNKGQKNHSFTVEDFLTSL